MDLMEYKAKELFDQFNIPTMKGIVIDSVEGLAGKITGLNYPVVCKAQVQVGGRGKAGGIKFAENAEELIEASRQIVGMDIKGHVVKQLLIVEKVEVLKEFYLSIMLDRLTKGPMVIFSAQGGMDIEEVAKNNPEQVLKVAIDPLIGINDYVVRYLISKSGLAEDLFAPIFDLLRKLYRMFCAYDCMLAEINPLVLSGDQKIIALDGKVSIDDNAMGRQPDMLAYRDSQPDDALILEARRFKFLYIPCEPEGNIAVMSNGSGMIMSCIDLISKQGMQVGAALDLGGGATRERIKEAIRIILDNPRIEALFINIFGGITRCDEVAAAVKEASESLVSDQLLVVRFEGTNKDIGLETLSSSQGNSVVSVDGLREGVTALDAWRKSK
jgi:succinyl-CoA synthetase beta subunit